eukprot:UN14363
MYIAAKQANKTIKNLFIAFCTNQKKTKARAKEILQNRANNKDAGVVDFFGGIERFASRGDPTILWSIWSAFMITRNRERKLSKKQSNRDEGRPVLSLSSSH